MIIIKYSNEKILSKMAAQEMHYIFLFSNFRFRSSEFRTNLVALRAEVNTSCIHQTKFNAFFDIDYR